MSHDPLNSGSSRSNSGDVDASSAETSNSSSTPSGFADAGSADLTHVSQWVFDLDDTLYPASSNIMTQVEHRMTQYVAKMLDVPDDVATGIRNDYYRAYGTTLNGLMANHVVDTAEFLDYVHDIDASVIDPTPNLERLIKALPGRRIVYTNGSFKHAENILEQLGLTDAFDEIFDVEASGFTPKPHREGFEKFVDHFEIPAGETVMFEDSTQNLKTAASLGFTTVWVHDEDEALVRKLAESGEHIHYAADCLATFLSQAKTSSSK
jgi:putative hydrolase of the HAD superfamily